MIPADCIIVIITHQSITLVFKTQTHIDLLTHSVVSYDSQDLSIMFASPDMERIYFLSSPP